MLRVSRCCQNGHDITFVANLWLCPVCLVCFGLLVFFCSCFCFLWGWHQRPSRRAASIWRKHGVDYYSHASVSAVGCSVRFAHTVCGSQQQQQQPVQSEPVWPDRLLPLPLPPAEETLTCWFLLLDCFNSHVCTEAYCCHAEKNGSVSCNYVKASRFTWSFSSYDTKLYFVKVTTSF